MKRIFYDTEFLEDGKTIDLISVGMVNDEGREYYAQSTEFDLLRAKAHPFVGPHVLPLLNHDAGPHWKTRQEIARDVYQFLVPPSSLREDQIELWAYFGAYDHVALAQLWGPMVMLPQGIPMFTHDLVQLSSHLIGFTFPEKRKGEHNALEDARWNRQVYHAIMAHTLNQRHNLLPDAENALWDAWKNQVQHSRKMTRSFDEEWDSWKAGDYIVWAEDKYGPRYRIKRISDDYVWWDASKQQPEQMTRATNLLRVTLHEANK